VNVLNAMEPEEATAVQGIVDDNLTDADYSVEIEASADFEEQFQIRAEGGTLDIALLPQPGTVAAQAAAGTSRRSRTSGSTSRTSRRCSVSTSCRSASTRANTTACRRTST